MRKYRSPADRAVLDIAAFLVVLGIIALIGRVANAMYYAGLTGAWVPALIATVLSTGSFAWLCWRLSEYERIRRLRPAA